MPQSRLHRTDVSGPDIVSAPLWDSKTSTFAGLLTSTDYINVIQYYLQNPERFEDVDRLRLSSLRGTWTASGSMRDTSRQADLVISSHQR